jgi:hypothetical protein
LPGIASACQTSAWDIPGAVTAGGPPTNARYSGLCAAKSLQGQFVTDENPGAEPKYFVQFYVFTGATGANDIRIFQADGAAPGVITVDYNPTAGEFKFGAPPGTGKTFSGIAASKWYMIRMSWDKQTNLSMLIEVQGNGGAAFPSQTITGVNTGQIDTAKLGWVSGTGSGFILTDAFVSQRATPPTRLPRGDANNSGARSFADASSIVAETLNGTLGAGQPDCNENGTVNFSDASCVVNLVLNGGN